MEKMLGQIHGEDIGIDALSFVDEGFAWKDDGANAGM